MITIFTLLAIVVVGWLIFTYLLPLLPEPIRTVAVIVLVFIAIVWLLGLVNVRL